MKQPGKIYILPLGEMTKADLNWLCGELEKTFELRCDVLDKEPIPKEAYRADRGQYHATAILKWVTSKMPPDALRLIAIADADLYTEGLNFVFGQASPHLGATLISTYRLHQSAYGLPEDDALYKKRLLTEAVHELGHTFGLNHCTNRHCAMYFSNTLADTDEKGFKFCDVCKSKLKGR